MDVLVQDIRYGIRQLLRQRGSSIVAILTLALGIGASTAVFTVIDAAILRPLPYPDPEQLVVVGVEVIQPDGGVARPTASMDDMRFWQKADDVFSSVAGWGNAFGGRIVEGPEPERIQVLQITEDYLPMHGVTPILGRGFNLDDIPTGAPEVALLGYGYWQSRYGGRPDVVGETIRLSDGLPTIVGVLPRWFNADTPLLRPLRIPANEAPRRGTGRVSVYGRLRPGVTIEQARNRLSVGITPQPGPGGTLLETRTRVDSRLETTAERSKTTVNVLAGAVVLILLIACVNVAGLLLARGAARQPEIAVRASLGAGPIRLMRQLLTESFVLALAGGVAGVLMAWLALDVIVANIPITMPANAPARVNFEVLLAAAALLIPTVIVFGIVPAVRLSQVRAGSALGRSGRQQTGSSLTRRGGQGLIAAEVALAVVLVAGAGLMIRTFSRLAEVDLGFDPEGLMTMEVLPLSPDGVTHRSYYTALLEQIRSMPGIGSAGGVDNFPLGGRTAFTSVRSAGQSSGVTIFGVLPGYFETMGVALRDGRLLTELDYASGRRGAVISETAARSLFPDGPAVGRQFTHANQTEPWTVLGVVADVRHGGPLGEVARSSNQVYLPFEPNAANVQAMLIVLRPAGPVPDLAGRLRRAAQSIGAPVLIESIRPANDWFGDRVATPWRRTVLLGLLGGLGLALALVGVFGMTAYAVARRTSEIGVRMALGARPAQVMRTILRDSVVPIVIGTVVGLGGAAAATRVIRSFLFETEPTDPVTFTAVALTLGAAGCLAALIPSLRAARIDPVTTLRTY